MRESSMDLEVWGFGALAVAIALALSSVELLTKYRSRNLKEIFYSRYYAAFALLNAFFCAVVYAVLPHFGTAIIKTDVAGTIDHGWLRSVTAGLGYLVIARTSLLDIKGRDGATYGAGFDAIYNGFAQYFLNHHNRRMQKQMRDDFQAIFQPNQRDLEAFQNAARGLRPGLAPDEWVGLKAGIDLAVTDAQQQTEATVCLTLYQLIRENTADRADALNLIQNARTQLPPRSAQPQ